MNHTDEELTRLFEAAFRDQDPGKELWETTRASMRRKVRARRAVLAVSMLLIGVLAVAAPQMLLLPQLRTDVEFADTTPGQRQGDPEPGVSHTEKPLYLWPSPEPRQEAGEPSPAETAPQAELVPEPDHTGTTPPAPHETQPPAALDMPPPITFTSHRSGDTVALGDVTVTGESCTYEATVYLTLIAPDGTSTDTFTTATDACRGQWQHTFTLTAPGVWTIIASGEGDGLEGNQQTNQASLTLQVP